MQKHTTKPKLVGYGYISSFEVIKAFILVLVLCFDLALTHQTLGLSPYP